MRRARVKHPLKLQILKRKKEKKLLRMKKWRRKSRKMKLLYI